MADNPLHLIPAEPAGNDIADLLERLLREAELGQLSSIAVAYVDREGCVSAEWSAAPSSGLLAGAIARLAHRYHLEMDD